VVVRQAQLLEQEVLVVADKVDQHLLLELQILGAVVVPLETT
jgi:hypothetical protein